MTELKSIDEKLLNGNETLLEPVLALCHLYTHRVYPHRGYTRNTRLSVIVGGPPRNKTMIDHVPVNERQRSIHYTSFLRG